MDAHGLLELLRRYWLSIAVMGILGGGIAFAVAATVPKVYSATSEDFVSFSGEQAGNNLMGSGAIVQRLASYSALVRTPMVLDPVIKELGLNASASELATVISAEAVPGTVLIRVTAIASTPETAATLANAVGRGLGRAIERIDAPPGAKDRLLAVTLINEAEPSPRAVGFPPERAAAGGLLAGLLIGMMIAFLRSTFSRTIETVDQVRAVTGMDPIGVVFFDSDASKNPILAPGRRTPRAEAIRALRTNLRYVDVDAQPTVITLTSPEPGDGKTTTACNLAIALAQSGLTVMLLEADLRRPRVAEYAGIVTAAGLTDVLVGRKTWREAAFTWGQTGVTIMASGPLPPNPSELLGSAQMRVLVASLREAFDAVIIDAPPLIPVTDGAVVATASDGAVILVRQGRTPVDGLTSSVAALERAGARLLGTVLNFVPVAKRYYAYGYGYGYGEGYETKAETDDGKGSRRRRRKPPVPSDPAPEEARTP